MDGTTPLEFTVTDEEADVRLEQFIRSRIPGISRGSVLRLLERKQILVDGHSSSKGHRLRSGQQVLVAPGAKQESPLPQPEIPLDVLKVLPDLVIINKAPGLPCHPLVPGETDTVANALVARFPECASASPIAREGGLLHRLDWSTSGVLIAARNPDAYGRLRGLFSSRQAVKHYLALVGGHVDRPGRVSLALRTMPGDYRKMEVVEGVGTAKGQSAETEFWPLRALGDFTLLSVICRTGRRHQVRVHLAHLGHPLVGDEVYKGPAFEGIEGAFLHASRLQLQPQGLDFEAPLPADRQSILARLGASL
jgi:23S rRNA pseudouridine1911/1915/1917 synthase